MCSLPETFNLGTDDNNILCTLDIPIDKRTIVITEKNPDGSENRTCIFSIEDRTLILSTDKDSRTLTVDAFTDTSRSLSAVSMSLEDLRVGQFYISKKNGEFYISFIGTEDIRPTYNSYKMDAGKLVLIATDKANNHFLLQSIRNV